MSIAAANVEVPLGFELIACPACDASACTIVHEGRDWSLDQTRVLTIVRCDACGLHYTNPRPTLEHLPAYYPDDYAPYAQRHEEGGLARLILRNAYGSPAVRPKGLARPAAGIASVFKSPSRCTFAFPFHGQGRLLDFGCGGGTFLRRMAALGWTVTGIDFSAAAVRAVRESGLRAIEGTLPHPQLGPKSFDAIFMRHSLEHLPNPGEVLGAAREMLADDGLLVIQVPNFASFEREYFGDAALVLDLPRHLLHFTPGTLRGLLNRCGFEVRELQVISRSGGLRKSFRQLDRRGSSRSGDWLYSLKLWCQWSAWCAGQRGQGNEIYAVATARGDRT